MVTKGVAGRYAKFLTAAAGIGIVYAQNQFGASNQWVQLAVAIGAALGVLAVPNTPPPAAPLILVPGTAPWPPATLPGSAPPARVTPPVT